MMLRTFAMILEFRGVFSEFERCHRTLSQCGILAPPFFLVIGWVLCYCSGVWVCGCDFFQFEPQGNGVFRVQQRPKKGPPPDPSTVLLHKRTPSGVFWGMGVRGAGSFGDSNPQPKPNTWFSRSETLF